MKRSYIIPVVLLIVAGISVCAVVAVQDRDQDYRNLYNRHMLVVPPETPASASFAGEEVPMDLYYVKEAFEREILANTFMQSTTIMIFKRANRWFPVIEPILKKNGIPDDFKFLAVAESNLVNVTSPAGADGYWQFMKETAKKHGLEINDRVDERYNMEKATQAACEYLLEAHDRFGSWTLAAASYNRGSEGIRNALESQGAKNYYDLYLNDETSRYVFRILALKEIWNHPVKYGFLLRQQDLYPPVPIRTVTVDSPIVSLPAFARANGVSYRVLRELNPWIRHYSLPNPNKRSYTVRFPAQGISAKELGKALREEDHFFHDTLKINQVH